MIFLTCYSISIHTDYITTMASDMPEEPLFDPSLKKKKKAKKQIDLSELDDDTPAATPAAAAAAQTEDATPKDDEALAAAEGATTGADDDMFGGLKKKKKSKKAIPMDLDLVSESRDESCEAYRHTLATSRARSDISIIIICIYSLTYQDEASGSTSAPTMAEHADAEPASEAGATAAENTEDGDLTFGDMKKKKKKSSKKAAFDMDAFEKELGEGEGGASGAGGLDDDAELGDNPFAEKDDDDAGGKAGGEQTEAWHGTDRDYTYQEVSSERQREDVGAGYDHLTLPLPPLSSLADSLVHFEPTTQPSLETRRSTQLSLLKSLEMDPRRLPLPI